MAHRHNDHEKKPLAFFSSPLVEQNEDTYNSDLFQSTSPSASSGSYAAKDEPSPTELGHSSSDEAQRKQATPVFRQHAEASKAELFFDLCKSDPHFTSTSLTTFS
jgi:hypothetical protein